MSKKDLTNKFCHWILFHKLYKKVSFMCAHIKIHVSIWDELKKVQL
jgi:hypothetical protein